MGAEKRAFYFQGNLSLVEDNRRIINELNAQFESIDTLIFCAAKHSTSHTKTSEGIEQTFALAYLSRFILSYGLKELLEKSNDPIILNICGSGMNGDINWTDLQFTQSFDSQKVMMHGSRLNDLLGVAFNRNDRVSKIRYIMYNPWAVITPGMMHTLKNPLMRLVFRFIGKSIDKAVSIIDELLDNPPTETLSAFRERKRLSLSHPSYNAENAKRLYDLTIEFLQ